MKGWSAASPFRYPWGAGAGKPRVAADGLSQGRVRDPRRNNGCQGELRWDGQRRVSCGAVRILRPSLQPRASGEGARATLCHWPCPVWQLFGEIPLLEEWALGKMACVGAVE